MTRSIFVVLLAATLLAVVLPLGDVQAHESCDVPKVQTHRGIQGTFDQCVDASFTDDGDEYTCTCITPRRPTARMRRSVLRRAGGRRRGLAGRRRGTAGR